MVMRESELRRPMTARLGNLRDREAEIVDGLVSEALLDKEVRRDVVERIGLGSERKFARRTSWRAS